MAPRAPGIAYRHAPGFGLRQVKIAPGEHHVTSDPGVAISTVLGSCVAACIRDPVARVGGLNHFMLPESADGVWGKAQASLRYGNFAMERLVNDILLRGGRRDRLEVKLFGGARLLRDHADIGGRNATFAEDYLRTEAMPPVACHLRGERARRLVYLPVSGRAFMQELSGETLQIGKAEARLGQTLPQPPSGGSIELFD